MSGDQEFLLKLLTILMPLLMLVVGGYLAWFQHKLNVKLNDVSTKIDGMQDKLIASTKKASFQEGQTSERLNPEVKG